MEFRFGDFWVARMRALLKRMLDPAEFLSDYGIRVRVRAESKLVTRFQTLQLGGTFCFGECHNNHNVINTGRLPLGFVQNGVWGTLGACEVQQRETKPTVLPYCSNQIEAIGLTICFKIGAWPVLLGHLGSVARLHYQIVVHGHQYCSRDKTRSIIMTVAHRPTKIRV